MTNLNTFISVPDMRQTSWIHTCSSTLTSFQGKPMFWIRKDCSVKFLNYTFLYVLYTASHLVSKSHWKPLCALHFAFFPWNSSPGIITAALVEGWSCLGERSVERALVVLPFLKILLWNFYFKTNSRFSNKINGGKGKLLLESKTKAKKMKKEKKNTTPQRN